MSPSSENLSHHELRKDGECSELTIIDSGNNGEITGGEMYWDNEFEYNVRRKIESRRRSSSLSRLETKPIKSIMLVRSLSESLHSQNSSTTSRKSADLNVKFKSVEIREYDTTLGDNPSVSKGPAISLDWEYDYAGSLPIDSYEKQRGRPRSSCEMVMPRYVREEALKILGHSRSDIAASVREIQKVKKERVKTVQNMKYQNLQYAAECTSRRFKKIFKVKKSCEKDSLMKQWEEGISDYVEDPVHDEDEMNSSIFICDN